MNNLKPAITPKSPILSGDHEADTLYLKNLLHVAGLSQADIARAIGTTKTMVNKVILRRDNSAKVLSFLENLANQYGEKLKRLHVNGKY